MNLDMVNYLYEFKNMILHENRFFVSNARFLKELKQHIKKDLKRKKPFLTSTLLKGDILYRARVMDDELKGSKIPVTRYW